MAQAATDECAELAELRKKTKRLEVELEIVKRAAASFAKENVLPKSCSRWSVNSPTTTSTSRWLVGS
jgi:transposase-like protein